MKCIQFVLMFLNIMILHVHASHPVFTRAIIEIRCTPIASMTLLELFFPCHIITCTCTYFGITNLLMVDTYLLKKIYDVL